MNTLKRFSLAKQSVAILATLLLISCGVSEQTAQSTQSEATVVIELSPEPTHSPTNTPIPPTPTQALQAVVDRKFYNDWEFAERMRRELLRTDLNPDIRLSYEEQLWIEDRHATLRATAQANIAAGATPLPTETPGPTPMPLPRGVLDQPSGSYANAVLMEQNMWRDELDGYWWYVYAGADGIDPTIGALVVIKTFNHESVGKGKFVTPGHTGSLRIISAQDGVLTLHAEDGSTHIFDVRKFAWVP